VAGAFYNPEAPAFMSPEGDIEKWKGEEVRHVASDLVIAVLMVIILVLLALRFF
jgi:hypothetical protein